MTKRLEALKAAESSVEFFGNKNPKCPHCGDDYNIVGNDAWSLYDDNDTHPVECPSCDLEFTVTTRCSYTFSTDEQDDEEDGDEASAPIPQHGDKP